MIDKKLLKSRFTKSIQTYNNEAKAQKIIAERMNVILKNNVSVKSPFILEIGCGTGFMSRNIVKTFAPKSFIINDLCHEMEKCFCDLSNSENISYMWGDAESIDFPANQDMIVSCSTIQWFENINIFFKKCHSILKPGGYLAFSTFGKDNMHEFIEMTGHGLSYLPISNIENILSEDYEIIYSKEEIISLTFTSPIDVLYHIKKTGVTATAKHKWTKGKIEEFCNLYREKYELNGKVTLTYNPIYILVRKL